MLVLVKLQHMENRKDEDVVGGQTLEDIACHGEVVEDKVGPAKEVSAFSIVYFRKLSQSIRLGLWTMRSSVLQLAAPGIRQAYSLDNHQSVI